MSILVYPIPAGVVISDKFSVSVRPRGGEWQPVDCYEVEVDFHHPQKAAMAYFDFDGAVDVSITCNAVEVRSARVRPAVRGIDPGIAENTLNFTLTEPCMLSVEINGNIFNNLHLFAGRIENEPQDAGQASVVHFGPGFHDLKGKLHLKSNSTVIVAGGAVVKGTLVCDHVENIHIIGRGVLYQSHRGIQIEFSRNIVIDGITVINPEHYTVYAGQSHEISIRNLKSFSSRQWSDGIDIMSCSDIVMDGLFMRNSDDCIAIYGHRWDVYGDARNITVRNSVLWADVAHPVNIGTHGNPSDPETLEDIAFENIDVLNHDEAQLGYQGCFSLNASDENLIRNVRIENVRIDDFQQGQLFNFRVTFNRDYATAPGRGIENVLIKNVSYVGRNANPSVIGGYNESRTVKNVVIENLAINGQVIWDGMPGKVSYYATSDMARIHIGEHVQPITFRTTADRA